MICATAIVVMAYWQAQVAVAKETAERLKVLPPPVKTKRAIRPPAKVFSGDVVADYVARCEKGLTDQEIGWILEDYSNAGFDLFFASSRTNEQRFAYFRIFQQWYIDALADGLRLTRKQKSEATEKLAGLFYQAETDYLRATNVTATSQIPPSPAGDVPNLAKWMKPEGFPFDGVKGIDPLCRPENLCHLTPSQAKVATGEGLPLADGGHQGRPIFPKLKNQRVSNYRGEMVGGGILDDARGTHPAQLKMDVLLFPESAKQLRRTLAADVH